MGKKEYRNKGTKRNIVISIAGPHGVGKTTIFNLLRKDVGENNKKFKFYRERYVQNPPFPFGSKNKQIAFRSEIHFLQQFIRRNQSIMNFTSRYRGRILILDRSPSCVLIYSKGLKLKEKDYQLISDMYNSVKWKEDYILYLTASPETILNRITHRESLETIRKSWNEQEKNYLLTIMALYRQEFRSPQGDKKIYEINTDHLIPKEVLEEIKKIITEITGYNFKELILPSKTQMNLIKFLSPMKKYNNL
ncbi:MAG: deoxynucleoside kinase [Promethearchaeota archaeon]